MLPSLFWGFVGAASLLIGAIIALRRPPSQQAVGLIMGFGAGVLISALSFELVGKAAIIEGGLGGITLGLYTGCAVFAIGDRLLQRWAGPGVDDPATEEAGSGLSLTLGALLDGVPECMVLGLTILQGGEIGLSMLVAVFISNLPEGIAATVTLRRSGWPEARVLRTWALVVVACGLASPAGYLLLGGASPWTIAVIFSVAAGAILTMLATSMMPTAYRLAGRSVGPLTVAGFALAFAINWVAG